MDGWAASPVVPDGSSLITIIRNGIFDADVGDHSAAREKEAQKALEGFWCDPLRTGVTHYEPCVSPQPFIVFIALHTYSP